MDKMLVAIADYLWSQSWQIAVLVAAVAVISRAMHSRSAHARYLLWLLVVAKCLVPPMFAVAVPILPQDKQTAFDVLLERSAGASGTLAASATPETIVTQLPAEPSGEAHAAHRLLPDLSRRQAVVLVWLAGLTAFATAASIKAGRMVLRLMKERTELPADLRAGIDELFCSLGVQRAPRVWLLDSASQPFVWGFWRGDIYLPSNFTTLSNDERRRDILAHELSHILRLDAGVNLLQIVAQAVFWFHPLVWWANTKIRQEREKCCDEMAIARLGAQPRTYSRAIVEALLAEHKSNGLLPSLAIAGPAKNIEERIRTMLRPGKRFHRRPSPLAAVCALVLALLIVPTTLALTSRPAGDPNAQANQTGAKTEEEQIQQRVLSADTLKKIGLSLLMYMDHNGKYPDELIALMPYFGQDRADELAAFVSSDAEYLGAGKTPPQNNAQDIALAYDLTMLRAGQGTNVVFADGHVEFVSGDRLNKYGVKLPESHLKIQDIRFEPIHQGKNVVHVTLKNTSDTEQVFAAHIYTRSPDYGSPLPDPNASGVGWGTGGYFERLKPQETKSLRLVFKIQGPVTDRTYVGLRFYNPQTEKSYEYKRYFHGHKYMSGDLPKARADEATPKQASPAEAQAITQAFNQIQGYTQNGGYEQAWERFSKDYQWAEYQRDGLQAFRRAMEPAHPMHSAFTWVRRDFIELKPGQVLKRNGVLALAAALDGQTWIIDFVREDNQWKIDWIAGYVPAVLKMREESAAPAKKPGNLKVLDVQFEPVHQGKNVVRVKILNTSPADQALGIDVRAEGPIGNWQRQFHETVKGKETRLLTFDFEFLGPITDASSARLRFYNPASADTFDINNWFEERRYTSQELPLREDARAPAGPVSQAEKDAVIKAFTEFQNSIKGQDYQAAWNLGSEHWRSMFGNDIERLKGQMGSEEAKRLFLSLHPESVTRLGTWLTLDAQGEYELMKLHFVQEGGQWKIYEGQMDTSDWENRILPKMQKRSTAHFDIYYPKDSTAARDIDRIARQMDDGFRQICQFLGRDFNVRIRMVFFEDKQTKHRATGHQGVGWAYGNTVVEVYNAEEKLDPYHETTHILMGSLGGPPALFNEGFAVYISEKLGVRAMEGLGGGKATIYQWVRELKTKGDWIELPQLLSFTEIGPAKSRPLVSYPEAASFVKFLIDTYGKDKFLQAYQTLPNSDDKTTQEENVRQLEQICGKPLQTLQQQWEAAFSRS
jgi:prepilin-type processing-associated H-X9-DG protein